MQFKVPQNVQMEDRIVGPLTLKHMIILGAGGGLAYLVYAILSRTYFWEIWAPPVFIIIVLTVIAAFVKIFNVSFGRFILLFIEFNLLARKRKWTKSSAEVIIKEPIIKTKIEEKEKVKVKEKKASETIAKLEDLSKILDSYGKESKSSPPKKTPTTNIKK